MMRLIDVNKLKENLITEIYSYSKGDIRKRLFARGLSLAYDIVNRQPTEEPKHGHWIEHDFGLICSECNHYTEAMYDEPFNNEFGKGWALKRPYYCGYCGAKMDEVADETD